jgi:electron transfer flavoprotein beta subunit
MRVIVSVKQVPDAAGERRLRPEDGRLDRESADGVINELDEYAIEEELRILEAQGGGVTVLSIGPGRAADSVLKALSMGADNAVHLCDEALAGADAVQTFFALAQVLRQIGLDWYWSDRSRPTPGWGRCWPRGCANRSCP